MVVTVEKLARAIEKRLEVPAAEADAFSSRVMNYFGFGKYIIDNAIHQEDRRLFYRLQEAGLLKTSWETTLLLTGRSWRIFYWEIDEADLDRTLLGEPVNPPEKATYAELPDEAWAHAPPPG
ncbi:MAG TPA: DUF6015 family protein [Thermoplasmata archaeon]|nr:DUF6015 family protein [Thermoplasmata archaeon]